MARSRAKAKKSRAATEVGVASTSSRSNAPSVEELLTKARSLVTQCDYELAEKFVHRILEQQPDHADSRELLGVVQLESGNLDEAKATFISLVPPSPSAPIPPPPSAHLYLAQLSEDDSQAALKHYEAAADLLLAQLKGKERAVGGETTGDSETDIRRNIVRVLVAMVEIWMSPSYDLCDDPQAEETCERLLANAFEIDADNIEALICQSSFRLSQQRTEDAKASAMKAWLAWKDADDDDPIIPPLSTRIELTKRFIEISEYSAALLVLQHIMASDDQEVEAWYLEGWCLFLMAENAKEEGKTIEDLGWEELARDARECLENCRVLHLNQRHPDDKLLEHASELITQLETLGIKPLPEGEDDEDENEWEDLSDEDEDGDVEME